jgi:uncharacterized membrane protein YqgA involved in biofilm formation
MPFLGTIVNFFAVLVFGTLGTFLKRGIPKRISDAVISGMAICVIYIGIDGILEAAPPVPEGSFFSAGLVKVLIMILSMGIGTLIGELVDFDKLLGRLGNTLEMKMDGILNKDGEDAPRGNFSRGFVSCSMLFCVGAMAVNGAIQDALGDPTLLLAKTVIDSITCFVMASTLGIGCAFSAFFLLIYQGGIGLLGFFLSSFIPASTITYMSVTGSLIIILIGTNVLGVTKVKTANMVPAMFMPLLLAPLFKLIL